jgi:hypothetical protein
MGLDIDKIDASKWLDDLLNDTPNDKSQTVNSLENERPCYRGEDRGR